MDLSQFGVPSEIVLAAANEFESSEEQQAFTEGVAFGVAAALQAVNEKGDHEVH